MTKFLHLSDTHFHSTDEKNIPLNERFSYIYQHYPEHHLLITGDITDDGAEAQYKMANGPLCSGKGILVPGNHDMGPIGSFYQEEAATRFDNFVGHFYSAKEPIIIDNLPGILIVGLNSCLQTESPFDLACGKLGKKQLSVLRTVLETYADRVKIVMLHHHPFIHSDVTMMLYDGLELFKVIYQKADVLLFGHKHEAGYWQNKGGVKHILAAPAMFEARTAMEISIEGGVITVEERGIV